MVVGSGGAGKTTFARELGLITDLPVIHLDRLFWNPGWVETPAAVWRARVEELASLDEWILDGNYGASLMERIARAHAIVFFDISRVVCLVGALERSVVHQFRQRHDLPEGCREAMRWNFVRYIWRFPNDSRPRLTAAISKASPDVAVVTITNRAQAAEVLARLRAAAKEAKSR
jgi:adenylate kinase family enzyme